MKSLFVGFLVMLAMMGHASAEEFGDPKALVSGIYDDYNVGRTVADPTVYYSKRLKAIYDQAIENQVFASDAAMNGSEYTLNAVFNPFLPDLNALLFDVAIGEPAVVGERAVVTVSYHNFDQPRLLAIAMVKEGDSWKVDDVSSMGNEEHWLLSWALTYDPLGF
ncbi:MAG: hypothetical protein P0Y65_04130 [Candidatus Devosia phytovorans]|uniref:DUF3828 domain-containing protein n=1 Tax=Candidatus Devosia phytovorans TaxID=3121372 RepID=A0AAJ6B2D6_9HYPH|nr:hypothetical protein [Devosia sp.]WEK05453.1 MAG: hypothetical protein P0Y65_04130 [Devosia sp.]